MYAFLSALLILAVLRFGAVERFAWLGLCLLFAGGCLAWTLQSARRPGLGSRTDLIRVALVSGSILLALLVDPKLALGPMAGVWAWIAVRERPTRLIGFLHVLLALGVFEALLGLYQYFIRPGWIFGYLNTHYATSGTLINRNHFAGLLGMLIPVALGLAYMAWLRYRDVGRVWVYLMASAVMGLALMFSLSRMGIFSLFLSLVFLAFLIRAHSSRLGTVFLLVPLLLLGGGALWIGVDVIVERYDRLVSENGDIQESRLGVFRDTLALIGDHPLGIGPGAYRDAFRLYQQEHNDLVFTHAHNDYLETAAEWGLPVAGMFWGGILVILGFGAAAFTRATEAEKRGGLLAALGAIAYILAHSLTDFNLQIPSNAMLFFTFLGIAAAARTAVSLRPVSRVESGVRGEG